MDTNEKITNESKKIEYAVPYISHENECARLERIIKKLCIGWLITIIIAIAAVAAVDIGWRMFFENCDINTYELEQGSAGVNVVGSENEVKNGTESENQENPPEESASEKKN